MLFIPRPAIVPSRNGAMTLFPGCAAPRNDLKSTRRPPFFIAEPPAAANAVLEPGAPSVVALPLGGDSVMSPGLALCQVGWRGLSAGEFRRAVLAWCEPGVDFVALTWNYASRARLRVPPHPGRVREIAG